MNLVFKFLIAFLALTGATTLLINVFNVNFDNDVFWNNHGVFFLIFITLFPRLTLLFSSVPFGGFLWWLGFFFAPRFLVAVLATIGYWHQNPILVILAWLVALGGESGEKVVLTERVRIYRTDRDFSFRSDGKTRFDDQNTIEAEFRHRDD